jgi:bifunctional UDP-N-acetylglucosamine pyrophosphorylase/glucosamine-1-phosphate N-acetyltransferase
VSLEIIILAAGQGTRMHSAIPKVLHRIAHLPLLEHVYRLAVSLGADKTTIIYGHGGEQVQAQLAHLKVDWVEQRERLGTGHAVQQMADRIASDATVLILYGDVPLLRKGTVEGLLTLAQEGALGVLTVALDDPTGYGRIVRNTAGEVLRIVEEKDCSAMERLIKEGNSGILAVNGGKLKNWLSRLTNHNAQREYYLTDIIGFAVEDGVPVRTAGATGVDEVLGVNNREQLAHLERVYQSDQARSLLLKGVTLRDPSRFDLRGEIVALGQDIEIDVNVLLEGAVSLGSRVRIGPHVVIRNAHIGDDVEIQAHSVIDGAEVGTGCRIGPFARLRPETKLASGVHVGNFVEIKKSDVDAGSKINHLSYVGDASVGSRVNIGAGTITCNYDGVNKFRTIIEDGAFIGSDSQLVAPVRIGKNATIGAGSTITKDAPEGQLTLSRSKQLSIEEWQRPKRKGD